MINVGMITYPEDLPVSAQRTKIADCIAKHQVVVIAGETGSGKTTQLPKICLELGRGRTMIGHTQPRRIAARTVASRIAEELDSPLGELVGYQVRFSEKLSDATRIKLMTDGILLAELQRDRQLRRYDTIIIDEAHERSLNIDFLLGYLAQLLPQRPDLKVIITSATIDPDRFARHFQDQLGRAAPTIEVSGRTYPVEVRYRPVNPGGEINGEDEAATSAALCAAVQELARDTTGDILVFLPGEQAIKDAIEELRSPRAKLTNFEVLPLYSRLPMGQQHQVFAPGSQRRIIVSTNIAETSVTVPRITGVVDTGVARISRRSTRTSVQRLPIEPISQAAAKQRSGRCGRVGPGVAIRLYSEEDFLGRDEFTEPEILRTDLTSVLLTMAQLRLGAPEKFPFMDPPERRQLRAGQQLLHELGAIASPQKGRLIRLTKLGRQLAQLPLDPQLGRMIIAADRLGCLAQVIVIAAGLSLPDVRQRPGDQQAAADQAHQKFRVEDSDFIALLRLWDYITEQRRELSSAEFRRLCHREFLHYLRIREWWELVRQLRTICEEHGMRLGRRRARLAPQKPQFADRIHQALLPGLLSQIGWRKPRPETEDRRTARRRRRRRLSHEYVGARGAKFAIFPGSHLSRSQPEYVMAAELVETSRLWARNCAKIDPRWAEDAAKHLVKYSYSEPHWSKKHAAAMARQKVTLYGVPLIADRLVPYGRIDPEVARDLFIRHGLVGGEWDSHHQFLQHNRELLEAATDWEHRARRSDLVVDEEELVSLYDRLLPSEVISGAHFDSWWKEQSQSNPELLMFTPEMLTTPNIGEVEFDQFPQHWEYGGAELALEYEYQPGTEDDGVTVTVPTTLLAQLEPAQFSWHVPGLREELVIALLRGLPKSLRVNFVPIPDTAAAFLAAVTPQRAHPEVGSSLGEQLCHYLRTTTGVLIDPNQLDWSKVPAHLRPQFQVVDDAGAIVGQGRDLAALQARFASQAQAAVAAAADNLELTRHTGCTSWDFGELPVEVPLETEGRPGLPTYPAVVDEGDSVAVRTFATAKQAESYHPAGVRRLLALNVSVPDIIADLDLRSQLSLAGSPYPNVQALIDDCVLAASGSQLRLTPAVRTQAQFDAVLLALQEQLAPQLRELLELLPPVLEQWRELTPQLAGSVPLEFLAAYNDMNTQLGRLVYPGFISAAGLVNLQHYSRYLTALQRRLEKLPQQPHKDQQYLAQLMPFQQGWLSRHELLPANALPDEATDNLRWAIEEFRVSLWAQELGTSRPVSAKRLTALLQAS